MASLQRDSVSVGLETTDYVNCFRYLPIEPSNLPYQRVICQGAAAYNISLSMGDTESPAKTAILMDTAALVSVEKEFENKFDLNNDRNFDLNSIDSHSASFCRYPPS